LTFSKARCSGGDKSGDPENTCGDVIKDPPPDPGDPCWDGTEPLPHDGTANKQLETYSDPVGDGGWAQITFCNGFFNKNNLADAMTNPIWQDLQQFDNRARIFFHEATHQDYFMNAPGVNPQTNDLQIEWKEGGFPQKDLAYGALNARILGRYRALGKQGYYTQRNGKYWSSRKGRMN
jgi:hypothetical protein